MKSNKDFMEVLRRPMKQHTKPGTNYKYVKGSDVISRLNEAFDCMWSSEVMHCEEKYNHILVHIRLIVWVEGECISHEGFGSAPIMRKRGSDEVIDIGNNYKSAYTNALKKAAEQFGIGLDSDDDEALYVAPTPPNTASPTQTNRAPTKEAPKKFAAKSKAGNVKKTVSGGSGNLRPRPKKIGTDPSQQTSQPVQQNDFPNPTSSENRASDIQINALKNMQKKILNSAISEENLVKGALGQETEKNSFDQLTKTEAVQVIRHINTAAQSK